MLTIKCTNNKQGTYAITVGTDYEVLKTGTDHFFLRNDKNHVVKYSKKLFTENGEQDAPVTQRAPAQPRRLTEAQMIASITVDEQGDVTFQNRDRENVRFESSLVYDGANGITISCGIGQVTGINNTGVNLDNLMNNTFEEDYIALRNAIFTTSLNKVLSKAENKGMVLISTNTNEDNLQRYYDILNELSNNSSAIINNPNSGNPIKLWMFYVNQA